MTPGRIGIRPLHSFFKQVVTTVICCFLETNAYKFLPNVSERVSDVFAAASKCYEYYGGSLPLITSDTLAQDFSDSYVLWLRDIGAASNSTAFLANTRWVDVYLKGIDDVTSFRDPITNASLTKLSSLDKIWRKMEPDNPTEGKEYCLNAKTDQQQAYSLTVTGSSGVVGSTPCAAPLTATNILACVTDPPMDCFEPPRKAGESFYAITVNGPPRSQSKPPRYPMKTTANYSCPLGFVFNAANSVVGRTFQVECLGSIGWYSRQFLNGTGIPWMASLKCVQIGQNTTDVMVMGNETYGAYALTTPWNLTSFNEMTALCNRTFRGSGLVVIPPLNGTPWANRTFSLSTPNWLDGFDNILDVLDFYAAKNITMSLGTNVRASYDPWKNMSDIEFQASWSQLGMKTGVPVINLPPSVANVNGPVLHAVYGKDSRDVFGIRPTSTGLLLSRSILLCQFGKGTCEVEKNEPFPAFIQNNLTNLGPTMIPGRYAFGSIIKYSCKCSEALLEYVDGSNSTDIRGVSATENITVCRGSLGWTTNNFTVPRCVPLQTPVVLSLGPVFQILHETTSNRSVLSAIEECYAASAGMSGLVKITSQDDFTAVKKILDFHCFEGSLPLANNIV